MDFHYTLSFGKLSGEPLTLGRHDLPQGALQDTQSIVITQIPAARVDVVHTELEELLLLEAVGDHELGGPPRVQAVLDPLGSADLGPRPARAGQLAEEDAAGVRLGDKVSVPEVLARHGHLHLGGQGRGGREHGSGEAVHVCVYCLCDYMTQDTSIPTIKWAIM